MVDMPVLQIMRLFQSLKRFENFKNEKLMNNLKKATVGKQIGSAQDNHKIT